MKLAAPKILQDVAIELPASKSISNRLLIIQALSKKGQILNLSEAEDTKVLKTALEELPETIHVGHAGTAFRFLTAYLSVTPGIRILTGSERMKSRPIAPLVDALRDLGATVQYVEKEGFPPLKITGNSILGGEVHIEASVSSQFITALMLIGPTLRNGLKIHLTGNVVSLDYIKMTASLMRTCGAQVNLNKNAISVAPKPYSDFRIEVEKDWSAAAFWYELVLIGEIEHLLLKDVKSESIQGDSYVSELFGHFGVESLFDEVGLHLKFNKPQTNSLPRIVDFSTTPDLVQPFVVALSAVNESYVLAGTSTLQHKETNRGIALKQELAKFGGFIDVAPDSILTVQGINRSSAPSFPIETYQDHRMAMCFAPLSMIYGTIEIENPEVVGKSYPNYWVQLQKLGFTVSD